MDAAKQPQIKKKFGEASDLCKFGEVIVSSKLLKLLEYQIMPKLKDQGCLSLVNSSSDRKLPL